MKQTTLQEFDVNFGEVRTQTDPESGRHNDPNTKFPERFVSLLQRAVGKRLFVKFSRK